ncbi:MAG: hypothetical protein N2C14_31800, partial [Planctomycetales bacterium]
MDAFVVGDHPDLGIRVQQILERNGVECPEANVISLAEGLNAVEQGERFIVILSPDAKQALQTLTEMNRAGNGKQFFAVGPPDAQLILKTIKLAKYIDETNLESALTAAFVGAGGKLGKLIAVLAPSGGSGSSVIAANLATALAASHKTTSLIDLKLAAGVCDALLNIKPTHTIADLCRMDHIDPENFEGIQMKHSSGVFLLCPPHGFDDVHHVTRPGIRQILTMARSTHPYVVVDLDRTYGEEQVEVLYQA